MTENLVEPTIAAAERRLEVAEHELADAIRELGEQPRSSKTITTLRVEHALDDVRSARAGVSALNEGCREDEVC